MAEMKKDIFTIEVIEPSILQIEPKEFSSYEEAMRYGYSCEEFVLYKPDGSYETWVFNEWMGGWQQNNKESKDG